MADNMFTNLPLQGAQKNKKRRLFLLALLILAALVSSCIAGYILGKSTMPDFSGQLIDTILLAPEKEERLFYLTGQVAFSDGRPYEDGAILLHSEPKETRIDKEGRFAFFQVEKGEHTVSLMNDAGETVAERQVNLKSSPEMEGVKIGLQEDGAYIISASDDIRLLEVVIEIDEESKALYINESDFTYVTGSGKIVTPAGAAYSTEGTVITPGGSVIIPDGTIITPSSDGKLGIAVITPKEEVIYPDGGTSLADGTVILNDGSIKLFNGLTISTGGETIVTTPGGERIGPGTGGIIILEDNRVIPIGEESESTGEINASEPAFSLPQENSGGTPGTGTESLEKNTSKADSPEESGSPAEPDAEETLGTSGSTAATEKPGVTEAPDVTETSDATETTDMTETSDTTEDTGPTGEIPDFGVSWTQGASLSLFADRTGDINGKIVPGTKGYYPFELKNGNGFDIDFSLSVREGELHIPMRFRIVENKKGGTPLTDWWSTQEKDTAESKTVRLKAKESVIYYLEWEWMYEGGRDEEDTNAGLNAEQPYIVELSIYAEQVIQK
ncbi:carboxypeptidase regulatory-like domain-containing protein [Lacrimispora sp. NSJ-141]|uniref:Carboxypeptidase regulatory-like domain-containing protein n=1 Tax=Lientehia hominis TaxID=2897778 RepID=A0AAP2RLI3_9FIRM|nr:carboxypeptidase regulatory-like domain-containing protein [Lientehia hominis]MCD2493253.1 carboxypeptidase regulatory-like domain-containing protein [Lientehia hominis]